MRTSEQINELADALAKAQSAIEGAVRGNVNPAFRSRYADLGAVWDAIREPLSAAGIAVVQALETSDGRVICTTRMMKGGQWIEADFSLPVAKQDAHGYGAAASYARRYSLMAMVGVPSIDTDANDAVGRAPEPPKQMDPFTHDPVVISKFRSAKSTDEIKEVWQSIPTALRHRYTDEKDAAKVRLSEQVPA
jgi:hypothetical protein